ncbi:HAD family hydrolase [Ectothiorhodospira sp. BSL-9]|uniref:HAD family hydrolase n=1 Tax=Ectothiorhodospira sp. BSL-9 TaxID=1442136 RepID=UPI0007B436D6|nr:HAD family hydrolase [Ectothiorhodospira sp. BSL-9]ANB01057.1 phosphatase [Ectothiorhodospira sp. BSL-9]
MSHSLKALIWDVDGTLADTERDGHRVAFNEAFAEAGLDWHWSVERYAGLLAVTGGKERIRYFLKQDAPTFEAPEDLDAFVAGLHARKTARFAAMLEQGRIPLRPGVERLLQEARASGVRLAIATTTSPANVEGLLRANLGEASIGWFQVIGAGDVVPDKKPAPDIYHHVLEGLDLSPAACLAIEDSGHGLAAALGAGIGTVMTVNGYTADEDFTGALAVLDHLGEPGRPCRVLRGEGPEPGVATLSWLQALHERRTGRA